MNKLAPLNVERVRVRLKELELKQYWVANEIGISKATLTRWLNGRITKVHVDKMRRLAVVLGTNEGELRC